MTQFDPHIGQRFVVGFQGVTAPDYILDWLREGRIGGVILFDRNVKNPEQLAALTRSLHAASEIPIVIGIDQEGGMVARMRQARGFTESAGQMALAAADDNLNVTERMSRILADEMRSIGINWTYAPVVDLSYNAENPTVGTRSFGRDPRKVGELAAMATKGFQSGGVIACAKHFPGLGNTSIDSHVDLPTLDTPLDQLVSDDLEPYRHVVEAEIASIMTTHTIFSALDTDYPATLSETIIQTLLRDKLAYQGLIVTDCLEMDAIRKHYGEGESAVRGILAGVDLLLISHTRSHQEAAFAAVDDAIQNGRISEANIETSYQRIITAKQQFAIDIEAIDADATGTEAHLAEALDIARSCVSLEGILPTLSGKTVGVVEFGAFKDSIVMDANRGEALTPRLEALLATHSTVMVNSLTPESDQVETAQQLASVCDVLVVVTRNAHLHQAQQSLAESLLAIGKETVLISVRNPYDSDILSADAILNTYSPSAPALQAAADALAGIYHPTGHRPMAAEV